MSTRRQTQIGPMDRIHILLKEYDALRAEVQSRITHRWQMLGLMGVILAFIGTQGGVAWSLRLTLASVATVGLAAIWLRSGRYIVELHSRVAEIERAVNRLAGQTLFRWESCGPDRFLVRFHTGR